MQRYGATAGGQPSQTDEANINLNVARRSALKVRGGGSTIPPMRCDGQVHVANSLDWRTMSPQFPAGGAGSQFGGGVLKLPVSIVESAGSSSARFLHVPTGQD